VYKRERGANGELLDAYKIHAYQYAYTSVDADTTCQPAYIVYVENDDDIITAIAYARENNIAVAVRSGGHQYNGASSTAGDNIQLDLSGREAPDKSRYRYKQIVIDKTAGTITLGAGCVLEDVNLVCEEHGIFFPHGECCKVHIGGHANTGGVSIISPAFGMMIDHVISARLITADGIKRDLVRPVPGQTDADNDDLWFCLFGGSPGNYGILTDVTVKYLKDADYPKTVGIKLAWPYTKENAAKVMQLVAEVNDDEELAHSINVSALILGSEFYGNVHVPPGPNPPTYDDFMTLSHPELAGEPKFHYYLPMIAVVGAFSNPGGAAQDDSFVQTVFQKFRDIRGWEIAGLISPDMIMDGTTRTGMSTILKQLTWENPREFTLSYHKMTFFCDTRLVSRPNTNIGGHTFAQYIADQIDRLAGVRSFWKYPGIKVGVQIAVVGGPGMQNPPAPTAAGHRMSNFWFGFGIFYNPGVELAKERATRFYNELAGTVCSNTLKLFASGRPHRVIGGPCFFNDEQPIMDELWEHYWDSQEVYERLLRVKEKFDPQHVFTANLMCVGATKCDRFKAQAKPTGLPRVKLRSKKKHA
jgi:hypothetical protein